MLFNRTEDLTFGPILKIQPTQDEIRTLPQFFRADLDMVRRLGGPHLRYLLERLPLTDRFRYISIDTRAHMLMPGWFPCIPGWHCDDFFRGADGQPDLERLEECAPSRHHSVVFGVSSFTEFVTEPLELPAPQSLDTPQRRPYYGLYHQMIEERRPQIRGLRSGELITFGPLSFHRGTPATVPGWRYFLRATESNHWEPVNELRTQTQVYLTEPFYQW